MMALAPGMSGEVNIPISESGGQSTSAYVTPESRRGESPDSFASFHTPEQHDYNYQDDVNSEILESPSSSPPDNAHFHFSSDGHPHPVILDEDIESRDSFDEGGYVTATQVQATRKFVDPDQPKLLLADDPVQPLSEKRPPQDIFAEPPAQYHENYQHEELHDNNGRPRQRKRDYSSRDETSPLLLPHNHTDTEEKDSTRCCTIL